MLDNLKRLPEDPILGLMAEFRRDTHPAKMDLGVGVYRDENGGTPILDAVRAGERQMLAAQTTKTYVSIAGNAGFNAAQQRLQFGADHPALQDGRICTVQSPGGSGGLRVAAEFILSTRPGATIWAGNPTWANHIPLLGRAGLTIESYPYYDFDRNRLDFDAMASALDGLPAGELVLLHGCCHNPSGADLSVAQWDTVTDICERRDLIPFIDMAYQGLGHGVEEDAYGVRLMARRLPEVFVISSCSKNFGLYRERTGTLSVVARTAAVADTTGTHLNSIIRGIYSMPPDHGAAIVSEILHDETLTRMWEDEVTMMRERMQSLRRSFVAHMRERDVSKDFSFIEDQIGMFSFLGIGAERIQRLKDDAHIYIVGTGRINVAGMTAATMDYLADSIATVLGRT